MSRAFGLAWRMSRLRAGEDKMAAATDDWNRIDSSEKRANRHCFMLWTIFGGVARGGYFLSSLSLFSSIWFLLDSTLSAAAVCCVFFKVLSQESWVENIFQKSKWGGGGRPTENIFACEEENVRPENTCKLFQVHVFTKNSNSVKVHFQWAPTSKTKCSFFCILPLEKKKQQNNQSLLILSRIWKDSTIHAWKVLLCLFFSSFFFLRLTTAWKRRDVANSSAAL